MMFSAPVESAHVKSGDVLPSTSAPPGCSLSRSAEPGSTAAMEGEPNTKHYELSGIHGWQNVYALGHSFVTNSAHSPVASSIPVGSRVPGMLKG